MKRLGPCCHLRLCLSYQARACVRTCCSVSSAQHNKNASITFNTALQVANLKSSRKRSGRGVVVMRLGAMTAGQLSRLRPRNDSILPEIASDCD
jgi:hypothetical protein